MDDPSFVSSQIAEQSLEKKTPCAPTSTTQGLQKLTYGNTDIDALEMSTETMSPTNICPTSRQKRRSAAAVMSV
ncbi:hypothetical protein AVEN_267989-1 [Araneus ventricosus]|uniref:Uncharacterized protein n=1 Tax=Araneus ventricosus TaxID=182803 RepID=A0A4Y2HPN0_ARAVE|nr:hypothetical protein AVEN_267989-1 [Araneus ventricosus]